MRLLLLPLSLFVIAILPINAHAEMAKKPAVHAILFYADWCGSCKILDPQLEKARGKHNLDNHNVLFTRFDMTNEMTRNQSHLLASAMGVGDLYKANEKKTGFLLLIDGETGAELAKFTKESKADEIAAKIAEKAK